VDGLAESLLEHVRTHLLQQPPQAGDVGIAGLHREHDPLDPLDGLQFRERALDRAAIGAHQAASAQLRPPEIARHHGGDITDTGVQQHVQHGPAGGAVRLARVAHADARRAAGRSGHEGPAVVRGVRELGAHPTDERARNLRGRREAERGNEAAALDHFFGADGGRRYRVAGSWRAHCHARCTGT
jgi:hypothetical protein